MSNQDEDRQAIWSLPTRFKWLYFILFQSVASIGVILLVRQERQSWALTPGTITTLYLEIGAVVLASAVISFWAIDLGGGVVGLSTLIWDKVEKEREKRRKEEEEKLAKARKEGYEAAMKERDSEEQQAGTGDKDTDD